MTTSKSPRTVMAEALAAGKACLKPYAHRFAPRKFTQPQLFACLVLKEFERKDYRGVCQLLRDCPGLREVIGLTAVPHWTTLQKAAARPLRAPRFRRLLAHTVRRVHGKRRRVPVAAGDSSGFDAHHASRYFVVRSAPGKKGDKTAGKQHATYRTYGKLMVVICCLSHAVLAAVASKGPTPDIDQLAGVLGHVPAWVGISAMVLDAGFDSAANHRLLRQQHGIRSTIPPGHGRPPKDPRALPKDKYRRMMKHRFKDGTRPKVYGQRSQVETVFSMLKRNLGAALRGRSHPARMRDLHLRVLTHNLMLALLWVFYRAGSPAYSG
jgi:hypothetical protein